MTNNQEEQTLFDLEQSAKPQKPVECLGIAFENDEKRREYFMEKLREKLKDPEFRKIEGFPIGEDEDILALSDPPYYTACPNPFIGDFIKQHGKPYDAETDDYRREPFATDVSEGKYDPLYKIHAYPTKVPFRAIIRYILHFTQPGDLIFDGFAGTGMVGVAAKMCGNLEEFRAITDFSNDFLKGQRKAILCDLSPNATHIASNYIRHLDANEFKRNFSKYIARCEEQIEWLYQTHDPSTGKIGTINYMVWSEIFFCEHCSQEYSYWESAVTYNPGDVIGQVENKQTCPHCGAEASRRTVENAVETVFDPFIGNTVIQKKHLPVLINYTIGQSRKEKKPDDFDLKLLKRISDKLLEITDSIKIAPLMLKNGDKWGDLQREYHLGITHTHHFFSKRNLYTLSILGNELKKVNRPYRDAFNFLITASFNRITNLVRYMPQYKERNVGPLSGTLYKPMLFGELNILNVIKSKVNQAAKGLSKLPKDSSCIITTQSSSAMQSQVPNNSIDYIFTDPPFGDNLPYSELNFNEESWIGVHTNTVSEAIVSKSQMKDVREYKNLIGCCFREKHRILKPGHWITVVFHNSRNTIWNAIQEALFEAGFVVADVRILDKKRGTTKQQVYTSGAVKQDLVISAYKPNRSLEERFKITAEAEEGIWDFVRTHLNQLPVFVANDSQAEVIAERQNFLLFDRMMAFYVQRGVTVPLSAAEFYAGLEQRFPAREGMYFLSDQAAEYDKKRLTVKDVLQLEIFVKDEASAIEWLKQQLTKKPQTFQDLHPQFLKELGGWQKHEKALELSVLLEQNVLHYDSRSEVPSQIHGYLSTNFKDLRNLPKTDPTLKAKAKNRWYVPDPNKAADLEKLRERALIREFEEYCESKQKRLRVFRLEAVRAGFKKAWQERDYDTIITVANKISEQVLQEDSKLLMWYDQAMTRKGADA